MELPAGAQGTPCAVCDYSGLVFGIAASGATEDYVHLYDARNYAGGAFCEFKLSHSSIEAAIQKQQGFSGNASDIAKKPFTSLAFNASGNQLLATGEQGLALLLDGFEGTIQRTLCSQGGISACFTPDDKTVLMGNKDGTIGCWNVDSGSVVKKLGGHTGPVGCIAANPTKEMFASSCTSTALWLW
jgi:WD40 repeat protein